MEVILIVAGAALLLWIVVRVSSRRGSGRTPRIATDAPGGVQTAAPAPPKKARTIAPQPFRLEDVRLDDPLFCSGLQALEAGESVFLTGRAGTGKSTLLRYFREKTTKSVVVLAPTGVAALNIGGQTIHSFFRLPPRDFIEPDSMTPPGGRSYLLLNELQTLVIDEVSMVRADILDCIDRLLQMARSRPGEPFGGVQLVLVGDPFQLPPVVQHQEVRRHFERCYGGPYFFLSRALKEARIRLIELQRSYRQSDPVFLNLLNQVRENRLDGTAFGVLQSRVRSRDKPFGDDAFITATPTNAVAQHINSSFLAALPGPEVVFNGAFSGDMRGDGAGLPAKLPTDDPLVLKEAAQVMLVRNDAQHRWVNGSIGIVDGDPRQSIRVRIGPTPYQVEKCVWEKIEYTYDRVERKIIPEVVGSFTQYPLKLGWAFTIHKVQGLTIDRLYLDLAGGAFAHGQTYTALSRCRSLDGLALGRQVRPEDVIVDSGLLGFRDSFRT